MVEPSRDGWLTPRPPFLTVDTVHGWFGAHGPRRHELPSVRRRRASTSLTSVRRLSKLIGDGHAR